MSNTCRIGVGGPVGSGKTALIEAITPYFLKLGLQVLIITNDIVTTEDAKHVRKMLKGYLAEERIIGVETGACPHTAAESGKAGAAREIQEHSFQIVVLRVRRRDKTGQGREERVAKRTRRFLNGFVRLCRAGAHISVSDMEHDVQLGAACTDKRLVAV